MVKTEVVRRDNDDDSVHDNDDEDSHDVVNALSEIIVQVLVTWCWETQGGRRAETMLVWLKHLTWNDQEILNIRIRSILWKV